VDGPVLTGALPHGFNHKALVFRQSNRADANTSDPTPPALQPLPAAGPREFIRPFQEGLFVNKTELVEHIAKHADISKAAATRALDSTITAIRTTLKKGGTVSLVGFGSFAVTKRPARKGRNPRTGAEIKIKAAKVPKFRPGKALKDALN
jgi:DNA-binding protein HU-beta